MTREEFKKHLTDSGFDQLKAQQIVEALLKQISAKGKSEEQAMEAISADLQTGGKISRQINELRQQKTNDKSSAPDPMVCPNCGYALSKDVPGFTRPGECPKCGIIFNKIKSDNGQTKAMSSSLPANEQSIRIAEAAVPSGEVDGRPGFIARHKWITVLVGLVIVALIVCPIFQISYKKIYQKRLAAFDQQLKMDTQEEFEKSLDNLKIVIETAAIMVAKRGWSKANIEQFFDETKRRLNRFLDLMDEKAAGQDNLHGYKINEIRNDLGSGMHMLLLLIRDKDMRLNMLLRSSMSVNIYDPGYNPDLNVRGGNYILCNPGEYKGSSLRKAVRDGNEWVLKEKSESEKARPKNAQNSFGPTRPVKTEAEKAADEAFEKVKDEIRLMQYKYRRTHDNRWCEDLKALVEDHLSVQNATVSRETMDMINSNSIAIKMTNGGRSYDLIDLRKK